MTDNFLRIPKVWLVDEIGVSNSNLLYKYGELGFAFYISCKLFEQAYDGSVYTSIGRCLDLFGFTNRGTRKKKREELLQAIKRMENDGIITFYSDYAMSEVVSLDIGVKDTDTLCCVIDKLVECEFFVRVSKLELMTIVESKGNKLRLLIHYISIMCYEDLNKGICFPPLEVLSLITQISQDTCRDYNKMLYEIGVLYYDNAGTKYIEGAPQSFSNTYSRWANKGLVDSFVAKIIAESKDRVANTTKAKQERTNQSRRLIGIVNHLNRKEKEIGLTAEEIIDRDTKQIEYDALRAIIKKDQDKGYEHFDKNKR